MKTLPYLRPAAFLHGTLPSPRVGWNVSATTMTVLRATPVPCSAYKPSALRATSSLTSGNRVDSVGRNDEDGVPRRRGACRVADVRGPPVAYGAAWRWQHALASQMRADPTAPDALLLLEHAPVYTLGTASSPEHVLFGGRELRAEELHIDGIRDNSIEGCGPDASPALVRTERGGEVTYHGPGQLVAYPILNLARHRRDLHWYLRSLEEVVIVMLQRHYSLDAQRKAGLTGVWVGDKKVCAMGLKVSKWVTMHGLALNVTADLAPFDRIVPCGIQEFGVSSLQLLAGREMPVNMDIARLQFLQVFNEQFGPYDSLDLYGADVVAELDALCLAVP